MENAWDKHFLEIKFLGREIVSFASFSFRKEKRKEVKMKTQDEVAKSAEMCVIGSILIDEKALENVVQTLKPEHIYFGELKVAY